MGENATLYLGYVEKETGVKESFPSKVIFYFFTFQKSKKSRRLKINTISALR